MKLLSHYSEWNAARTIGDFEFHYRHRHSPDVLQDQTSVVGNVSGA